MNIVIATGIYPPDIGGPASLSYSLAKTWREAGHNVKIVTYGEGDDVDVARVSRSYYIVFRYFFFCYYTWKCLRNADVMLIQGAVSEGLPATIAGIARGVPRVLRVPGDYAWEIFRQNPHSTELLDDFVKHRHHGKIFVLEAIERWVARHAQAIVTPSQYLKKIVCSWNVSAKNIHVILNTVNPFLRIAPDHPREVRGLQNKKIFLCVARAVPWKRFDFLLRVFAKLDDAYVLVLAGDGPQLQAWKCFADELGITSRVIFLGRVSRDLLASWYLDADAFVLASSYEGYPFVVAEAVSFGLPCFLSDKAGNIETKEQYPEQVTLLPWNDELKWCLELSQPIQHMAKVKNKSFTHFAQEIFNVLKAYARIDD